MFAVSLVLMDIPNDTITVDLQALTQGGSSIGPIVAGPEGLIGKKAFIPYTIPDEQVTAQLTKSSKSFVEAKLLEVLKPSKSRTDPACPYYTKCGGCQLQHIELAEQRQLKLEMVASAFRVKKIFPKTAAVLLGTEQLGFNYRRRISLHVSSLGSIGFYKSASDEIVEIDQCLIAKDELNKTLSQVLSIKAALAGKISGVAIEEHDNLVVTIFKTGPAFVLDDLAVLVGDIQATNLQFKIIQNGRNLFTNLLDDNEAAEDTHEFGHFAQVNKEVNDLLVSKVCDLVKPTLVDDLYAGAGNLALALAKRGATVRAVEFDKSLVRAGKNAALLQDLDDRLKFSACSVEQFIERNELSEQVVLDPPRSGAKYFCNEVNRETTKDIVYVSCSLPNLVRDSSILLAKGYQLTELYVLDMFPQTFHVEMIARFA